MRRISPEPEQFPLQFSVEVRYKVYLTPIYNNIKPLTHFIQLVSLYTPWQQKGV